MIKRGDLERPGHRRRQARLDARPAHARARATSLDQARRPRRGRVREAPHAPALRRRRLRRSGDVQRPAQGARRRRSIRRITSRFRRCCSAPWSSSLRRPAARTVRASSSRSRSATTSRQRAEAQRHSAQRVRRGAHLPHRPLPRQAAGAQHAVLPLRQRVPRADLEPRVRGERADHDGREFRRAGPRQVLRRDRHGARRRAEPSLPGAVQPCDGAAGAHRQRVVARREGQGAEVDPHDRAGRRRARPVPRLSAGAGRRTRLAVPRPSPR